MKSRSIFNIFAKLAGTVMSSAVFASGYDVTIGAGGGVAPRYLGSDQYRFAPIPYLSVTSSSGFYLDTMRGAGYKLDLPRNFYIDGAINFAFGRKDHNVGYAGGSDALRGMGNVPNAAVVTMAAGYRFMGAGSVSVAADVPVSQRSVGDSWRVELKVPLMITSTDVLTTDSGMHVGSATYNRTMWGVTASQSATSGFRQYNIGGGINAVNFGLTWTHMFDRNRSISTSAQVTRIVGDAGNSPIVFRRVALNLATIAAYNF
ncbi:MipA/OmpV family protein [Burkholderia sp. MSMB1078WGS]|uniref:MipA/OmpV family protein n=1 Tax=Burkholderia sp. MSMB1078WGS TaxID=1637900 RepID=UPI0009EC6F0F|nr:MipA/OmpV family protein [Burkholderia sp. MSMB1078WGS]